MKHILADTKFIFGEQHRNYTKHVNRLIKGFLINYISLNKIKLLKVYICTSYKGYEIKPIQNSLKQPI